MLEELGIRESVPGDSDAIDSLYPEAFPDETLLRLVRDLLRDVGHAIFTRCGVVGGSVNAALLGPLAVAPAWQRQGIGSAMVRAGLRRLEDMDVSLVCVLGDPAYYKRLGFLPESIVEPPFRLPAEWGGAWQSQSVGDKTAPTSRPCMPWTTLAPGQNHRDRVSAAQHAGCRIHAGRVHETRRLIRAAETDNLSKRGA